MHNVTIMLGCNSYVRCLLIDFSKTFDTVRHSLILAKLGTLDIPPTILNWIVHFLTVHFFFLSQVTTGSDSTVSGFYPITQGQVGLLVQLYRS